jgi:hypothetical protein
MAKSTPLDYAALNQELGAIVDEFSGMKAQVLKHIAPQPELKQYRKLVDEWLKEVIQDLVDVQVRVQECGEAFASQFEVASETPADEKEAIEAAVAAATEPAGESDESTEDKGEVTEVAEPAKAKGQRRAPVPA